MTNSVIDRAALQRLMRVVGDDPAELRDLIECFLEEGPILVAELHAALASSDLDALRRAAHTLKSTARDFGAQHLEELCARLERDGRAGRVPNAAGAAKEIAGAHAVAAHELRELLAH